MAIQPTMHYSAAAPRPLRSFLHPRKMVRNLWSHRDLILQLTHRDIVGRYRAARLGVLWSILTPLIMLAIYTFVFSEVLGAKWKAGGEGGHTEFALYLFCGILMFNLFGEVVTRAPGLVVCNPNYVKRLVFPLEALVVSSVLTALFNVAVGYAVWVVFFCVVKLAIPSVTILYLPLVAAPVCLAAMGLGWIAASLGVFVRDLGQVIGLAMQVLFFATPVFYRIDQVRQPFRMVLEINPLSHALEDARRVMVEAGAPDWSWWVGSMVGSAFLALLGYAFFMKSKRAFADVL